MKLYIEHVSTRRYLTAEIWISEMRFFEKGLYLGFARILLGLFLTLALVSTERSWPWTFLKVLGLGLALERQGPGLGLDLATQGLNYKTADYASPPHLFPNYVILLTSLCSRVLCMLWYGPLYGQYHTMHPFLPPSLITLQRTKPCLERCRSPAHGPARTTYLFQCKKLY